MCFVMAGISLYGLWVVVSDGKLPSKTAKPYLVGLMVVLISVSYVIYEKQGRGDRIISEYEKAKNQKRYLWLGAVFTFGTFFCPMWLFLLLRAIAALKQ